RAIMQPVNQPLMSVKRSSSIEEFNSDSGIYTYLSLSSSPIQSSLIAPFPSIQEPVKLNFEGADLLPLSHFELFKQCDKTFLPVEDCQMGYLPLGCGPASRYPNSDLLERDVLASNTCISDLLRHQQEHISEQQQHLNETYLKQEQHHYSSREDGNRHRISENKSPVLKLNAHWQPPYESVVNDCQIAATYSTSEDLASSAPIISNHGMPTLPLDSPFPTTNLNGREDISPNVYPLQPSVDDHEMMINSLPEKGKLLEAVLKAGPLLQTLLLAGPLPLWQHPPPALDSFDIPLVPISPNPPLTISLSSPSSPEMTLSFPNSSTGSTNKSPPEPTVYDKNLNLLSQASPYAPLPSSTPTGSSLKKRFMSMDDSLHNARSSLKHTKLQ
ncbi:hypothetical protein KI387_010961, partial [Taxus chinensis]